MQLLPANRISRFSIKKLDQNVDDEQTPQCSNNKLLREHRVLPHRKQELYIHKTS